ncbi:MAG: SUMF1/EgtB/PvdO family nonheme iron enzyme [Gammaproteobacteria bacterium]|nr:SUMF1/EgtB/PvdO family nonheme iron enzyme [Gammaproteobacteria bacterium]MCP5423888.1 SUMF1/EgtB/PvdO family nonheme iron enzyme [Gammaproteobacteria bacterium]
MIKQEDQDLERLSKAELQNLIRELQAQLTAGAAAEITDLETTHQEAGIYRGSPPVGEADVLATYRQVLAERCAVTLPGRREPTRAMIQQWPALQRVFVDPGAFSATSPTGDAQPPSLLQAIVEHRRLVILGGEGSGKTTLLRRLCLALAGDQWNGLESWPENERDYLPLLVSGREFARWLQTMPSLPDAFAALLWAHISEDLAARGLAFAEEALAQAVDKGRALVLLDDLQDVPQALRKTVLDSLTDFAKSHHRTRLLITCQPAAYNERSRQLPEKRFPHLNLASLDRGRSDAVIAAWCADSSDADWSRILQQPPFQSLTTNPLLLTLLLWLGTRHPPLPGRLSGFCAKAVNALLGSYPDGQSAEWLRLLGQLAWDACVADDDPAAAVQRLTIDRQTLLTDLAQLNETHDEQAARDALSDLCDTGLLIEKEPAHYGFPHPLLGTYLLSLPMAMDDCFLGHALKQAQTRSHLAHLLLPSAATYKVEIQKDWEPVLDLLEALCEFDEGSQAGHKSWLAGDIAAAIGVAELRNHSTGTDKLAQVILRLAQVLEQAQMTPRERAEAGAILGNLGDPRFSSKRLYLPARFQGLPEKGLGFIIIKAGSFWMGSQADDPLAHPDELGQTETLQITYPYWLARYPVTVAQYEAFILAGGYGDESLWRGEAARSWRLASQRSEPDNWSWQSQYPNWPVTGINGFEAAAYCSWLDTQLRLPTQSPIPEDYEIRLPTEAEWEKAARCSTRGRYPWGNAEWEPERSNVAESGLAHPNPVGMYPYGMTPTGLLDMTGNVWEWTLSGAGHYPYDPTHNHLPLTTPRIARGGSWRASLAQSHCMSRRVQAFGDCDTDLGFRVVLSVAHSAFSRYQLF